MAALTWSVIYVSVSPWRPYQHSSHRPHHTPHTHPCLCGCGASCRGCLAPLGLGICLETAPAACASCVASSWRRCRTETTETAAASWQTLRRKTFQSGGMICGGVRSPCLRCYVCSPSPYSCVYYVLRFYSCFVYHAYGLYSPSDPRDLIPCPFPAYGP